MSIKIFYPQNSALGRLEQLGRKAPDWTTDGSFDGNPNEENSVRKRTDTDAIRTTLLQNLTPSGYIP